MISSVSIELLLAASLLAPAGQPAAPSPKPAEAKPAEAKPVKPAEAKPAEAKPAEAKPAQPKPGEPKTSPATGPEAPAEPVGAPGPGPEEPTSATAEPKAPGAAAGSSASTSGRRYSARGPEPSAEKTTGEEQPAADAKQDEWIHRWKPQANTFEVGAYGGVWFPSRRLELFHPEPDLDRYGNQHLRRAAPHVGLRAGYYPLAYVGVEVEGGVIPTRTLGTDGRATAWALRANVIGQLGLWSVTPFLLVGTGLMGMSSPGAPVGIGNDQDVAIQIGGGVKVFVNRNIQLRLDIRDVITNRFGIGEGLTSSPEILLGFTWMLGRRTPKKAEPPVETEPPPPANDRDRDTVIDEEDFCPDTFGMPPRGCPQVCVDDNDADGLPNPEDKCVDEPETRNGFEDGDGCPDEIPRELEEIAGVIEGIFFDNDKDVIKPISKPVLDRAVTTLKRYSDIRVRIVGHTSSTGGYRHNIDLSQRRAASVKRYLVEQGIEESRLETDGVGPDQPIDTNETPEGQARNRRIEFTILE
ncbi:OmpA family protein [Paraliomyxa miuraensis]|uniref:OmpA family protein n=1 Tax=Paraliomyxa miuraensis TaxID=376150 RepID=UPI00225744DD|nr:OmpA family protein [Paraliomyxa miuraensis]MCX4245393.1 OmpA family protein [Paraliomyxa miuraensis]